MKPLLCVLLVQRRIGAMKHRLFFLMLLIFMVWAYPAQATSITDFTIQTCTGDIIAQGPDFNLRTGGVTGGVGGCSDLSSRFPGTVATTHFMASGLASGIFQGQQIKESNFNTLTPPYAFLLADIEITYNLPPLNPPPGEFKGTVTQVKNTGLIVVLPSPNGGTITEAFSAPTVYETATVIGFGERFFGPDGELIYDSIESAIALTARTPEPSTWLLLGSGLAGLLLWRRRQRIVNV